jgi:hypothetical protein
MRHDALSVRQLHPVEDGREFLQNFPNSVNRGIRHGVRGASAERAARDKLHFPIAKIQPLPTTTLLDGARQPIIIPA